MSDNKKKASLQPYTQSKAMDEDQLWDDLQDDWDSDENTPTTSDDQNQSENAAHPQPPLEATTPNTAPPTDLASPASDAPAPDTENNTSEKSPKKTLHYIEKIVLGALAAVLIALTIWACMWLNGKNKLADTQETIQLPAVGQYATISALSTIWISPEKKPGVNQNAVIVPSAKITLDENASSQGALRLYFKNADKTSIGDTITLPFKNGKFSNGSNTIEITASDGFHLEGQFYAYQVDHTAPWRLLILEASDASQSGSQFKTLLNAPVSSQRK